MGRIAELPGRTAPRIIPSGMGLEVRWRIDPIFPAHDWQEAYADFFAWAAADGHRPTRITLGAYPETQPSLRTFAQGWGLPALEWTPSSIQKDGAHCHLDRRQRIGMYSFLACVIRDAWHACGDPRPS